MGYATSRSVACLRDVGLYCLARCGSATAGRAVDAAGSGNAGRAGHDRRTGPRAAGLRSSRLVRGYRYNVAVLMHHAVIAVPAESNVFHVLVRTPPMPDYVSAQGELYRINADGSIDYMGAGASPPLHQSRRW